MSFNISANDYTIIQQQTIVGYVKLYVLNFELSIVDEISGNLTSLSVDVNANSDMRRSCNVELVVTDSTFNIQSGGKIWIDKYIRPYVGYKNAHTGEIQWYNQGTYLINEPSWIYDGTSNTLKFQGLDMMSKLTGLRNGNLEGIQHAIPTGSNVRDAMITTLQTAGFNNYIVNECVNVGGIVQDVPYDIKIDRGGTVYDIIKKLRDILPQYQTYFDVDGVFHYEQIPFGDNEPIILDDDVLSGVTISESVNVDFESVKNYIEVYGRTHDVSHYASATFISGATVRLTINSLSKSIDNVMIGFTLPKNVSGDITVTVNNGLMSGKLYDYSGTQIESLQKDVYYVLVYNASKSSWLYLGHNQAIAVAKDDNPNSPFYIGGTSGTIRQVLYGGDYDNIMSDDLAKQRADIELYWRCRLNDSLTLSTIPIPWLDVNILIQHTTYYNSVSNKYMIQSYSVDYSSNTMSIKASKYYPYYNTFSTTKKTIKRRR